MPKIKQISNLGNYDEESNESNAIIKLLDNIQTGEKSAIESKWVSVEEVEAALKL